MDYHDHKPHLNTRLLALLYSGVGLRQSARVLNLSNSCLQLKARKIGRHLRRLNLNLRAALPSTASFQFDEFETFEGRRNTRPLSVPVLIERDSRFVLWAESAPIRPRGTMTKKRRRLIRAENQRMGPRKDLSARSIGRTLRRGGTLAGAIHVVEVETDEKTSYRRQLRKAFGTNVKHSCTNSKVTRDTFNPLFPINHTEAMMRDSMGRLRRRSWLASKKRRWLDVALHTWIAYRNYVRVRFNGESRTPAQRLGFASRPLTVGELLSWRQEPGPRSIHPLARRNESVAEFAAGMRRVA